MAGRRGPPGAPVLAEPLVTTSRTAPALNSSVKLRLARLRLFDSWSIGDTVVQRACIHTVPNGGEALRQLAQVPLESTGHE